jgi:hypothetical protein
MLRISGSASVVSQPIWIIRRRDSTVGVGPIPGRSSLSVGRGLDRRRLSPIPSDWGREALPVLVVSSREPQRRSPRWPIADRDRAKRAAVGGAGVKDFENLAENSGHLRYPRLHPARPQAACQGVGHELDKRLVRNMHDGAPETLRSPAAGASGRCRFGQGTFAGASGNDDDAPLTVVWPMAIRRAR